MPLCTEVKRGGKVVPFKWDYNRLSAMISVALAEALPDLVLAADGRTMAQVVEDGKYVDMSMTPLYYVDWDAPLFKTGRQVLKHSYTFGEGETEIVFKKGDVLRVWREAE